MDISKYFRESLGLHDNKSQLNDIIGLTFAFCDSCKKPMQSGQQNLNSLSKEDKEDNYAISIVFWLLGKIW